MFTDTILEAMTVGDLDRESNAAGLDPLSFILAALHGASHDRQGGDA